MLLCETWIISPIVLIPFARTEHDLLLPKPVKGTILAPKTAGIWRMSVKYFQSVRQRLWESLLRYTDCGPGDISS